MKLRRKEDNKRVLKPRYGQQPKQRRRIRNNNSRVRNQRYKPKKQSKTSKTTMLIIILALVAFVIGAGVGVSMGLGVFQHEETKELQNVTVEMTSNLNNKNVSSDVGFVDFNDPESVKEFNLTNESVIY